jgi:hypothetical protein
MAEFNGKYQYLGPDKTSVQEGPCRIQFDETTFTLTPEADAPLSFDLGDLDAVVAADWEVRLPIYTGRTLVLKQFGKNYDNIAHDLLEAYRNRTIQCLLLEDMEEIERFSGNFELSSPGAAVRSGPAEFRLYKTNLAVLPTASQGFQWRLADIDAVRFDSANYTVAIESGQEKLIASRLAKRTEEFSKKVRDAMAALATQSAQALHSAFPFLNPDQLQSVAGLLKEGRSASVARLAAINPKMPAALSTNAVDKDLKPYYDQLVNRTASGMLYAGFKMIRPEDDTGAAADSSTGLSSNETEALEPDADATGPQALYWFFFPLAAKAGSAELSNVVAWEASSTGGRATYFFRLADSANVAQLRDPAKGPTFLENAVRRLNRVLALLNFRRRPIYLSDDELETDPKFHRYAIAARRMPEVREVRASFLGRAFHSSPDAWQVQIQSILAKAGH